MNKQDESCEANRVLQAIAYMRKWKKKIYKQCIMKQKKKTYIDKSLNYDNGNPVDTLEYI